MRSTGKPANLPAAPPPSHAIGESNGIAPGAGMMQVRTGNVTAVRVQVPRDKDLVLAECIKDAGRMGEVFFYSWTVRDKNAPDGSGRSLIKGMSIWGANMLAQNWGNCTTEVDVVMDGLDSWYLRARLIDYEKGYVSERLFRQRKSEAHSQKMDADRMQDIAFQTGCSKAIRNAIEHGLPAWLVEDAMKAATDSAEKKYDNVPEAIQRFQRFARKAKISDKQLEDKIGRPIAEWTKYDCVEMAAVFRAIQQQVTTIAEEFPVAEPEKPPTETAQGAQEQPAAAAAPQAAGDTKPEAKGEKKGEKAPEGKPQG